MKAGRETIREHGGVVLMHQNFPARDVATHAHDEHQFFVPLGGGVEVVLEGGPRLEVGPGRMVWVPARSSHAFRSLDATNGEQLLGTLPTATWDAHGGRAHAACAVPASQLVKEIVAFLVSKEEGPLATPFVPALVCALEDALAVAEEGGLLGQSPIDSLDSLFARARDPRVARALAFLEANHFEELTSSALAGAAGTSERTLQRLFVDELGLAPKKILTLVRVREAMALLEGSNLSITDVAFEVGFGSLSRFLEAFRATTGRLPSDYRAVGKVR